MNFNFILILLRHGDRSTFDNAIPLVRHILSRETDKDLLRELINMAGKFQLGRLTDDIAEFIYYDDTTLKAEAVKALERIGTPKSLARLVQASKTEKCDPDILDAVQVLSAKKEAAPDHADHGPAKEEKK